MIKNYLTTSIKSLLNHKLFSVINILGLAVGLAACLLILLYVENESAYDKHWAQGELIYKVGTTFNLPGREPYRLSEGSALMIPALESYFSNDIELASRAREIEAELGVENENYENIVVAVDQSFIEIFSLETVQGNLSETFQNTTSIALSEKLANTLFGTSDVIGRTLSLGWTLSNVGEETDYRVASVYRLPAENTVLDIPALILFDEEKEGDWEIQSWTLSPVASYLKLKLDTNPQQISGLLNDFSDQHADISAMRAGPEVKPSERLYYDIVNIGDVYLDNGYEDKNVSGNKTAVQAFSLIAVLILLIACINFITLTTATATKRAAEVAIRKVVGATRLQLMTKYLGESFLVVLLSLLLGLMLIEMLLPVFESLLGVSMAIDYSDPQIYVDLLILVLLVSVTAGVYPALILTKFSPASIFHSSGDKEAKGSLSVRNVLVIFQFGISIALIIATSVIYLQVQFTSNRNAGFSQDNTIIIDDLFSRPQVQAQKALFRDQVLALSSVTEASLSGYHPMSTTDLSRVSAAYTLEGGDGQYPIFANGVVDEHFFATYEIDISTGRDFSLLRDQPALAEGPETTAEDISLKSIIINEAAVGHLGLASPEQALGRVISRVSRFPGVSYRFTVIGVVSDHQFYSLKAEPRPEVYEFHPHFTDVISIRYQGNAANTLGQIEEIWRSMFPDAEFTLSFLEQHIEQEFSQENKEGILFVSFSLFSIFIACLGLYGSASFTVDRRTKEIGIRKVMGAEVKQIVSLLMWQFSKPVLVANILAWPVAVWAMLTWLQRFPYQIDTLLLIPLCGLAGFIALSIAWLTVAGNTVKVATTNPVYALRYE